METKKSSEYNCDALSTEQLQEVCVMGLERGELWRPCVRSELVNGEHFWYDTEDDAPTKHGPFATEREALLDAIEREGVEDPTGWGIALATPMQPITDQIRADHNANQDAARAREKSERKLPEQQERSELESVLIQAIEASGFSVSGPTDSRAAEHGEPAWVCNARGALANSMRQRIHGNQIEVGARMFALVNASLGYCPVEVVRDVTDVDWCKTPRIEGERVFEVRYTGGPFEGQHTEFAERHLSNSYPEVAATDVERMPEMKVPAADDVGTMLRELRAAFVVLANDETVDKAVKDFATDQFKRLPLLLIDRIASAVAETKPTVAHEAATEAGQKLPERRTRQGLTMADVIRDQFTQLNRLVTNLLVENRNFESRYYADNVKTTSQFIREVLPTWHEGITSKIEAVQQLVSRELTTFEQDGDAERYRKLRSYMGRNQEASWKAIERLAAVACYVGTDDFDRYLDDDMGEGPDVWDRMSAGQVSKPDGDPSPGM
jgi:hypothetical protein